MSTRRPLGTREYVAITVGVSLFAAGSLLAVALTSKPSSFTAHGLEEVCVDALDVTDGSQVTVTDSSGKVIGTGTLHTDNSKAAQAIESESALLSAALGPMSDGSSTSVYDFTVTVPAGLDRYGVSVGGGSHGTLWESEAQMKAGPQIGLGCLCPMTSQHWWAGSATGSAWPAVPSLSVSLSSILTTSSWMIPECSRR